MKNPYEMEKSVLMQQWHPEKTVQFNGKTYHVVDSSVDFAKTTEFRFASVGSNKSDSREIGVFNTTNAHKTISSVDDTSSNPEKLNHIMTEMTKIPKKDNLVNELTSFVTRWPNKNPFMLERRQYPVKFVML